MYWKNEREIITADEFYAVEGEPTAEELIEAEAEYDKMMAEETAAAVADLEYSRRPMPTSDEHDF